MKVKIYCHPSDEPSGSLSRPHLTVANIIKGDKIERIHKSKSTNKSFRSTDIGIDSTKKEWSQSHNRSIDIYNKAFGEGNYELEWFKSERSFIREIRNCKRTLEKYEAIHEEAVAIIKNCKNLLGIGG